MTSSPHSRLGIIKHPKRLAIRKQERERSLVKWSLILADRDDIIASLNVRHFNAPEEVDRQQIAEGEELLHYGAPGEDGRQPREWQIGALK
jgi:hypothetical protein